MWFCFFRKGASWGCALAQILMCLWAPLVAKAESGASSTGKTEWDFRRDQLLIKPKPGVPPVTMSQLHLAHRSEVLHLYSQLGDLQLISVPQGETVASLVSSYQESGLVEFAEPDYLRHIDLTPNDPKFLDGTLWAL